MKMWLLQLWDFLEDNERMKKHQNQLFLMTLCIYVIGLIALFIEGFSIKYYHNEYWFIYGTYIFCGIFFLYMTFARGAYLYEPIVLIGILFFMTYSIAPLINIRLEYADCRGFDVMGGCYKATIIYIFSFMALLLGYYGRVSRKTIKSPEEVMEWGVKETEDFHYYNLTTIILTISYFWWIIGFLFFVIYFKNAGFSLHYVLTLGMSGEANTDAAVSGTLDFLYNFRFGMVAAVFYLFRYGKHKTLYTLMYIIGFIMFMAYGYRNMLVEMIVAPLIFLSSVNRKPTKISTIIKLCGSIIIMIAVVEMFRSSVRQGLGANTVDWSQFNFMTIYSAFQGNFDLYKTFYGIVTFMPFEHDYTWGQQLIWMTVTFLIPRAFWPGKPTSILDSLMPQIVGPLAVRGHMAMGTLAEYYGEFGIVGCIFGCYILGRVTSYTKSWYQGIHRTEDSMIAYAILYPMFMLLAVRGYMPLNYMHILFLEIPVMSVAFIKHSNIAKSH